jgi:hypothetical protein
MLRARDVPLKEVWASRPPGRIQQQIERLWRRKVPTLAIARQVRIVRPAKGGGGNRCSEQAGANPFTGHSGCPGWRRGPSWPPCQAAEDTDARIAT